MVPARLFPLDRQWTSFHREMVGGAYQVCTECLVIPGYSLKELKRFLQRKLPAELRRPLKASWDSEVLLWWWLYELLFLFLPIFQGYSFSGWALFREGTFIGCPSFVDFALLFWERAQGPLSLYTLYTHSELAQYVIIVVVVHHIILFKSRITGFTVIANRIHFTYPVPLGGGQSLYSELSLSSFRMKQAKKGGKKGSALLLGSNLSLDWRKGTSALLTSVTFSPDSVQDRLSCKDK